MKILFAASEAEPFIKSGGLADVAGSLTRALRKRQQACRLVLPLYEDIPQVYRDKMKFVASFSVPLAWRNQYCGVFEATFEGVKCYFLDNEYYFKRPGLYGFFDDAERFAFFSKAVCEMLAHIDFEPDIIHCNDWQTALVPVFLDVCYRENKLYQNIKTVLTVHNIQYQGTYDLALAIDVLGLPESALHIVEYAKDTNFLKAGMEQCDALTTVSPTYARELLDPWFAHGLDDFLRQKSGKMRGILNGIDNTVYDPETDPNLAENFSAAKLAGKAANKKALQSELGLEQDPDAMIIGMVTRLVSHKGLDLVKSVFGQIMEMNVQFVMLGSGEWEYERFFDDSASHFPGRVAVRLGFDAALAQRIYASCDTFLMPSKSEPCGLAQMISLRYGTLPIVRSTGGLADTIRDFGGEDGNGYNFLTYNAYDMLDAIARARRDFADTAQWIAHVKAAMACDFSWSRSASEYIALYKELV